MGRPCGCCSCCACRTTVAASWLGDRDFAGNLDLRLYPGFDTRVLDNQRAETSLFWRIRYQPDQAFVEWLTDNKIVVIGGSIDTPLWFPWTSETAELSGPVRDGLICGLDVVPMTDALAPTAPADQYFNGTGNFKYYNTNGSPFPLQWTFEDWPENPVALPWILEIGCARCPCLDEISWPDHLHWYYDPVDYYSGTRLAVNPDLSTLVSPTTEGECQVMTDDDRLSAYWPGDEIEPDRPPICAPDVIVWESNMRFISVQGDAYGPGRWIPGKGYGFRAPEHVAYDLAAVQGSVSWLVGWYGDYGDADAARAVRGDTADIDDVKAIWLCSTPNSYGIFGPVGWQYNFTAARMQWLVDWLALGNKTLLVDSPQRLSTVGRQDPDPSKVHTRANLFLSAIGSGLSILRLPYTAPNQPPQSEDHTNIFKLKVVSLESHPLAQTPEELFYTSDPSSGGTYYPISGASTAHLQLPMFELSGGTPLYEYQVETYTSGGLAGTHPCVAIEELGNGNRIIATSIISTTYTGPWTLEGLSRVPNIGPFIGRVMASI